MKQEYTNNIKHWYEEDPVLSKSMQILEESNDETQIKIAMNLIKVIMEHNISDNNFVGVDDILTTVESVGMVENNDRWYDINAALSTALNMLSTSPKQTQKMIAKEMAHSVINKIKANDID